jgi:hypothetical protein
MRISVAPNKTDAVVVIDADAVLAFTVSAQPFQPVAGWHGQVLQSQRGVQNVQFFQSLPVQLVWQPPASASGP